MSLSRRAMSAGALAAGVALALSACGGSSTSLSRTVDSTLELALLGDIATPDPDTAYDGTELNLVNAAYEGLVTYEPGNAEPTLAPALATDWTVSDDNTVFTFTLRSGVKFHDGTAFTSAAIEPSFARRTAVDSGPAYMVADVASVETPTDTQVVITLGSPNADFLDLLASPFGPKIISPKALEANSADNGTTYFADHDAGTGPYSYGAFTPGTSYELTAYGEYWGDKPAYSTVKFEVVSNLATVQLQLESGQTDGLIGYTDKTSFESYKTSDTLATYAFDSMQTPTMFINPKSATLGGDKTRVSFVSGIDFTDLATKALGDTASPTTELFPHSLIPEDLNQQAITYQVGALATLASGELRGKSLTIGYASVSPAAQALSDNLAAVLNSAGIKATSVGYAQGTYYSALEEDGAPDITFFTGFPDTAAPDAWARVFYTPSGGLDLFGAEVEGVEDLLNKALSTGDDALYGEIAEKVSSSGYWYSVAAAKGTAVFQKNISGVDKSFNPVITGVLDISKLAPSA